jgi:hypothetical protein
VLEVAVAQRILLTGGDEALDCVLPDRFQHPVAENVAVLVGDDERAVHEGREHFEDLPTVELCIRAHVLGGVEVEAAGEDGQPSEQQAFALSQQVVGRVDRGAQRLVPGHRCACAGAEHMEAVVEPRSDLLRRQHPDPGAASSIASGMPSSRWQICATAGAVSLVTAKFGRPSRLGR